MKVALAAYATVHEYSEGTEALAGAIGLKSKQTLINKVSTSPGKTHHLSLSEAERIMKATGDVRIIHALADEMGGVYVPALRSGDARSITVVSDISKMSQEFGALVQEVASDIEDGVITDNELKRIEDEANRLRFALVSLMSDLKAMHQSSKVKSST